MHICSVNYDIMTLIFLFWEEDVTEHNFEAWKYAGLEIGKLKKSRIKCWTWKYKPVIYLKCNTIQYIKLSTDFNHLKLKKKSWTIHSIRLFFPFFFKKRQRIEHMLQKLFMRKISILKPQKTQTVCRTASKMQRKILFNFFKFYSTMKNAIRQF